MGRRVRAGLTWAMVGVLILWALLAAAGSPWLAYRQPVYIAAGFAGIAGFAALLVQPLLALGRLPGLEGRRGRAWHRATGAGLLALIGLHVAGLWLFSPPDVMDALTFASPTPFSAWGVLAMWAALAAAGVAAARKRMGPRRWRRAHGALAALLAGGTILHVLLIEGTMGRSSKLVLSLAVALAAAAALRRAWR